MNDPLLPERPDATAIRADFLADETRVVARLLPLASSDAAASARISARARGWVEAVRARQAGSAGIESFLQQYDLSTQEGVLLMCVAEALLRIPDAETADRLIRDKLSRGDWEKHLGQSPSLLVNASTWGLMLTGRLTQIDAESASDPASWYERVVARAGEPVVRVAIRQAMRLMAEQFVMGRTIAEALARSRSAGNARFRHSFDMLGESALTAADAARYHAVLRRCDRPRSASRAIATRRCSRSRASRSSSPRCIRATSIAQRGRVLAELVPALTALAKIAKSHGIGITIDAEEAERLELSLEIFARLRRDPALAGWEGLGLAVQAYQKRALAVIDWLIALGAECGRAFRCGWSRAPTGTPRSSARRCWASTRYPVFTRKAHTDVSYLACAGACSAAPAGRRAVSDVRHAQRAHRRGDRRVGDAGGIAPDAFEFQRLHGMGEALYDEIVVCRKLDIACRVYAPVGSHQDLLPYLVRRLLENGANTSFVNRIGDTTVSIADIVADPVR